MAAYVYWFVLALILLGAEMATGTFYIVVLSIAVAIAGLAALAGWELYIQMSLAGIAGVVGIVILRHVKSARPVDAAGGSLDIGQTVKVLSWNSDGTARVHYRGADWDAEPESTHTPHESMLYIKAMRGSTLILTHHKS
jgi:membrane protein implicated in regulation of membrane protease activity